MKAALFIRYGLFLSGCLAACSFANDWSMFMGNAQHTGMAESGFQYRLTGRSLKLAWQYSLHGQVSASPVVADHQLFVGTESGNLYGFDLDTKKLLWLYHTEGGIASTPAVADGRLYFLSRDGFLYALEQATGQLLWRFATGGEPHFGVRGGYGLPLSMGRVPDPWDFYVSSPLVHGGRVYVGSSNHHVYALDAARGTLIWSFEADSAVHSSPAYANNRLFIGTWGTRLYAIDAQTGREIWHFQGGTDLKAGVMLGMPASPTLDGENVYIGARDGFFYGFRQSDGYQQWRYDAAGSWVLSTAAVDDANVYFATSDTGLLVALDKRTGAEKYRCDIRLWSYSSPVIVNNRYLFIGTMAGELYGFEKTTGKKLWYYQTPEGKVDIHDVIDDKSGSLRTDKLFAVGTQLQASVEYVKALGAFIASPAWVGGQLIAVTATGELMVFGVKKDHRQAAIFSLPAGPKSLYFRV